MEGVLEKNPLQPKEPLVFNPLVLLFTAMSILVSLILGNIPRFYDLIRPKYLPNNTYQIAITPIGDYLPLTKPRWVNCF